MRELTQNQLQIVMRLHPNPAVVVEAKALIQEINAKARRITEVHSGAVATRRINETASMPERPRIGRYAVNHCGSGRTVTGLTAAEVVQHIYRDDGQDYQLIEREDEPGVWNVEFKTCNTPFRPSRRIAFGTTEEEAEAEFLADSFKNAMWEEAKWMIETDQDYFDGIAALNSELS